MASYKVVDGDCRITSIYGLRKDPFGSAYNEMHNGIDFAPNSAGRGYPIKAIEAGTVLLLRYGSPELGNYVEILHPNGYVSRYQHLYSISSALKVGQPIMEGTYLGVMGTTGHSTGVHLHLGIRTVREQVSDRYIDPMPYVMGTANMSGKPSAAKPPAAPESASSVSAAAQTAPAGAVKAGDRVRVKATAKTYKGGVAIPERIKGQTYTVAQLSGEYALLKEIMSWVGLGDLEKL